MTATSAAAGVDAEARSILERAAAASFPPLPAVHHLHSVGVRFVRDASFACLETLAMPPHAHLLQCQSCIHFLKSMMIPQRVGLAHVCPRMKHVALSASEYCNPPGHQNDGVASFDDTSRIDIITSMVSQAVQRESYQIDEFSLEISLPAVVAANERAIRLYMKQKYGDENWFKDEIFSQQTMSVKDALRLLIVPSLEKQLDVKHGNNSFRIRLTYTHDDASLKLNSLLPNDRSRKRKTESRERNDTRRNSTYDDKQILSETDSFIHKTLEGIQDQEFCSLFQLPPEKVFKPCHLVISCLRSPIYIGGRYLKLSRNVSQSCWIIDDERMGEASVEEIIGENVRASCRGDGYKFHAAGREDIDVRMLGSGRPFLIEVLNARSIPSAVEVQQIAEKINSSEKKYVRVRNLKLVDNEIWAMMREGEAEKQKQYAALVWTSSPLTDDDLQKISAVKDMEIIQNTPIRVLHRRSPLERKRIIHWMEIEKVEGSSNYYLLHLCTQAGTYIKEFVHGDLGRTNPSIGAMLGCRAEILQLDVTDVKMDLLQ